MNINSKYFDSQLSFYKNLGVVVKDRDEAEQRMKNAIQNAFFIWKSKSTPGSLGVYFQGETLPYLINKGTDERGGVEIDGRFFDNLYCAINICRNIFFEKYQKNVEQISQATTLKSKALYSQNDFQNIIGIMSQSVKLDSDLANIRILNKSFYEEYKVLYYLKKLEGGSFIYKRALHILPFINRLVEKIDFTKIYSNNICNSELKQIALFCPNLSSLKFQTFIFDEDSVSTLDSLKNLKKLRVYLICKYTIRDGKAIEKIINSLENKLKNVSIKLFANSKKFLLHSVN